MPKPQQLSVKPPSKMRIKSSSVIKGVASALHGTQKDARTFMKTIGNAQSRAVLQHSTNTKSLYDIKRLARDIRHQAKKEGVPLSERVLNTKMKRVYRDEVKNWEVHRKEVRDKNVRYILGKARRSSGENSSSILENVRNRAQGIEGRKNEDSILQGKSGYRARVSVDHGEIRTSALSPKTEAASPNERRPVATTDNWQAKTRNPLNKKPAAASSVQPDLKI